MKLIITLVLLILPFTLAGPKKRRGGGNDDDRDSYCPSTFFKLNPDFDMSMFQGIWYVQKAQGMKFYLRQYSFKKKQY